jgi:hypothetical protein
MPTLNSRHRNPAPLQNLPRPAAFIQTKHTITGAKNAAEIKEAQKMIDNYTYIVCKKPLREQHRLDLLYILDWKIGELQKAGVDVPTRTGSRTFEEPMLNAYHKRLEAK